MLQYEASEFFSTAQMLFLSAEYSACLEHLSARPSEPAGIVLGARVLARQRRYHEAFVRLQSGEPHFSGDLRAEADALTALLCASMGEAEASLSFLRKVSDHSRISKRARVRIDFDRAVCAWIRDDLIEAEALVVQCDTGGDPNDEARGKLVRSWIRAKRGRLLEQAALLMDALSTLKKAPTPDVGLMAQATFVLGMCARELHIPNALEIVWDALGRIAWTQDLQLEHYQSLRVSGWACALQGDYIPAIRQLQLARDIAPSAYYDVLSRFDRAWVARIAGESASCTAEATRAAEIALSLDWTKPDSEEAAVLPVGAEILAAVDLDLASALMDRFADARARMRPYAIFNRDPRLTALAHVAEASISRAKNDINGVRRHAKEAFDTYDGLGMEWRAAFCALLLYRAGCGEEWLGIAKANVVHYPRSFIAAEIRRQESHNVGLGTADLTARQREVFALLMGGSSIEEIASTLACSPNTVRIHIGAIYRKFGVRNRIELLVRAG